MALKSHKEVWSNFELKGSLKERYKELSVVDLMYLPRDCMVFIDEGYAWIEARASGRAINEYCSYVAFQLRKTQRQLFLTMQQFRSIDIRFRDEWDYLVTCERMPNGALNWRYWDFLFRILYKRKMSIQENVLLYENAKKYFSYFDTNEIIEPYNWRGLEAELLKSDEKRYWKKVKEIAEEILPELNEVTQNSVKAIMLKNGIHQAFAMHVWLVLKEKIVV